MKKKKEIEEVYSIQEELDKAKPYTEMYKKAYDFNTERFGSYAELMAFYQGNQHLLKKYKTERPWVVNMNTPYATVAIENRIASILVNDYEGDLIPLSPEDVDVIEPIDKVYKREWERLDIDRIIRNCVETSAVVREAYCHITVDDKKIRGGRYSKRVGALNAEIIDPSRVLIDPNARDLKDGKEDLASALTEKGVTSSANESLHEFSQKIRKLNTSQIGACSISPKIPQIQSTLNLNIRNESYKEVTV